jgi:hypothetical protein
MTLFEERDPCPECNEIDPRECTCHDCTACSNHEDLCICGTEDGPTLRGE